MLTTRFEILAEAVHSTVSNYNFYFQGERKVKNIIYNSLKKVVADI
jgi:hypothetical protein